MTELPTSAQEILKLSGNNFHFKVVNDLRSKGWTVHLSPYYNDNLTDKPREIDIIAEKSFKIPHGDLNDLHVQLFIECKYINNETVFWFDNKNFDSVRQKITRETPIEDNGYDILNTGHHYGKKDSVAKLFASKSDKNNENEVMFKAIQQSLNSLIFFKNGPKLGRSARYSYELYYPLIIVDKFEKFYKVDVDNENNLIKILDNFQLEVNYAYKLQQKDFFEYFLIDVVDFSKISSLLDEIEKYDVMLSSRQLIQNKSKHKSDQTNFGPTQNW